jgi:hypothetical protein
MKTSESITNIAKALIAFGKEVPKIPKDKVNPHFKNKYATLSIMIEKTKPILCKHGLVIVQQICDDNMATTLMHESGEFITSIAAMPCKDPSNPQAQGSAITYARRYAYGSILSLDIDDDDDANAATSSPTKAVSYVSAIASLNNSTDIDQLNAAWKSLTEDERKLATVIKVAKEKKLELTAQ